MTIPDIISLFSSEFSSLLGKFEIYTLSISEARTSKEEHVWKPGCYVLWRPKNGPLKVGRSLSNARKRALEHIRDDTGSLLGELDADEDARLILFSVKRLEDRHWAAAAEIFLEEQIEPSVKSHRAG